MSLFGKKKEEKVSCCCGGEAKVEETSASSCCCGETSDTEKSANTCCGNEVDGICCIKVLGAGCKSCHDQYQNVINAVAEMGIATDVQYITDMEVVMGYGVMSMPAIVVNEKVAAYGKVLKTKEVIELLKGY